MEKTICVEHITDDNRRYTAVLDVPSHVIAFHCDGVHIGEGIWNDEDENDSAIDQWTADLSDDVYDWLEIHLGNAIEGVSEKPVVREANAAVKLFAKAENLRPAVAMAKLAIRGFRTKEEEKRAQSEGGEAP